jgi:FdhD protein
LKKSKGGLDVESITSQRTVIKYRQDGSFQEEDETIAREYPLTIVLNDQEFATVVCTPMDLEEMVIGFLASEGIILFYDEIETLSIDEAKGFAYVNTRRKQTVNQEFYSKRFIGSCCGKSRQSFYFHNDARTAKTITTTLRINASLCFELMRKMQEGSTIFQDTGGVHNAALCDENGIVVSRTDIGRHNALDKIYGYCLKNRIPLKDKIIVFSGRISSEVLLKVAKIGVGIMLSKSAPTDLALNMADDLNITAVGFIRGDRMNVYTHPERIVMDDSSIDIS